MKLQTIVLAVSMLVIAGCSSTPRTVEPGPITAINNQKLSTSFERQGIKVGWECKWFTGFSDITCIHGELNYIEVSAYATSNGNSENNRETAFLVAGDKARAKLRHFIKEEVVSSRVTNILAKNVEKANDRIKSRISSVEDVSMSDDEASKDTNFAIRENSNDTARTVTEHIRVQANGILRGVKVIDEKIVDRQTVQVTLRWDTGSDTASRTLYKKFNQ
jgi:hypothetical protein